MGVHCRYGLPARSLERSRGWRSYRSRLQRSNASATKPTPCKATEKKRVQLMSLTGIGPAIAAVMTREVYYRQFDNRRQAAGFLGLATSPHDSGDVERSQGISRAGRGPSARDHNPGGLALAQAPAKECNHPLVCAANCRTERAYPTDHDRCGCAQIGDRAVALP
jgi:hypothetical protein